jgi:ribosomal protein S18 acetylase RimI-like enzyme
MDFKSSEASIHFANIDDISALFTLVNSAYRGDTSRKGWTTEADLLDDLRVSENELKIMMGNPDVWFFKYLEGAYIQGSVCLEYKEKHLYLGMLAVNPELQNSGIGAKLLKSVEEFAIFLGLDKIRMKVISVRSELLIYYYRRGYVFIGEKEQFPGNETLEFLVLEKKLI